MHKNVVSRTKCKIFGIEQASSSLLLGGEATRRGLPKQPPGAKQ